MPPTPYKGWLGLALLIWGADQLTKAWVRAEIPLYGGIPIVPGYLDIVHVTNTGAAFGFLAGAGSAWRPAFFYAISAVALVLILVYFRRLAPEDRMMKFILTLILGGLLGNLTDRLRFGQVTDFVSVHIQNRVVDLTGWGVPIYLPLEWPAFNVADSAISVAMVLIIWRMLRDHRSSGKESSRKEKPRAAHFV